MTKLEMFKSVAEKFNVDLGNGKSINEIFDHEYKNGEWMCEAVETQETLKNWDNSKNNWAECYGRVEGEVAGFKFLGWKVVQLKKGQPRRAVTVIDFGDFRVALDFDPSLF